MKKRQSALLAIAMLSLAPSAYAEPVVRIGTNLGDLFITLTPERAPNTVANFRSYIVNGDYVDTFFHFSRPAAAGVDGELRAGRFLWPEGSGTLGAFERDPIADEFSQTNSRGTVAMLRDNNQPDTATNGWLINTADNSSGASVFGELNARSLALVDQIADLQIEDRGDNFQQIPLIADDGILALRQRVVLILDTAEFESVSEPVAAVLPGSRTVPLGVTASAFATVLNTDTNNIAASCTITPPSDLSATFAYQLTNPITNQPVGSINPLVDIPAGGSGTFIFTMTPTANFASTEVPLDFNCGNAQNSVLTISGVNTFTLSAPAGLSSDVVAVARTAGDTGINDIPTSVGSGAFAVATANVGDEETISVTADDGDADLPITFFVCETNPTSGACFSSPSTTVQGTMGVNSTATFAIFAQLTDTTQTIDFAPAESRAYVRFRNSVGDLRGSTSVALRTIAD